MSQGTGPAVMWQGLHGVWSPVGEDSTWGLMQAASHSQGLKSTHWSHSSHLPTQCWLSPGAFLPRALLSTAEASMPCAGLLCSGNLRRPLNSHRVSLQDRRHCPHLYVENRRSREIDSVTVSSVTEPGIHSQGCHSLFTTQLPPPPPPVPAPCELAPVRFQGSIIEKNVKRVLSNFFCVVLRFC